MKTTIEFRQAVHQVMIDMALDCTFPSDINELCLDTIFEKANTKLEGDEEYQADLTKTKLADFISGDADLDAQFAIWESLDSRQDNDLATDHLEMWGGVNESMTIGQLADQL
tara:strand:+ start:391 stop:726 length:336 start_codon:yes stop_codon:yes gene_type:complete